MGDLAYLVLKGAARVEATICLANGSLSLVSALAKDGL